LRTDPGIAADFEVVVQAATGRAAGIAAVVVCAVAVIALLIRVDNTVAAPEPAAVIGLDIGVELAFIADLTHFDQAIAAYAIVVQAAAIVAERSHIGDGAVRTAVSGRICAAAGSNSVESISNSKCAGLNAGMITTSIPGINSYPYCRPAAPVLLPV